MEPFREGPEVGRASRIARAVHPVQEVLERVERGIVELLRGLRGRCGLHDRAHEVLLLHPLVREAHNARRLVRLDLDEALSREVGECLTKRHVREVETFGKRHDGQQLARCEVSAEDRTADDVGRDLSLRAVRGEVLGRRVLCRCRRGADRLPRHLL